MKRNENCCPDDYDFYTIPFPLKVFMYKKRNRYISSQLEKLHPCFSDDCSFDSHLRLEKSGLKADVVVMQKYRVAELKLLNKRLFVKERRHVQFFADRKKIKFFTGTLAAVVVFVSFVIFALFPSIEEIAPSEPSFSSSQNEELFLQYSISDLLSLISKLKGSISDFSWSYDGFNESTAICLCGLFPEQLEVFEPALKFSSVTFENSKPILTVSYSSKKISANSFAPQQISIQKNDIRQIIIQSGFDINEETVNPFGLKISIPQSQLKELIPLFQYFQNNDFSIETIAIKSSASLINLQLIFSQTVYENQNVLFESLIKNLDLFVQKQSPTQIEEAREIQPSTIQVSSQQKKLLKLGQIVKPDGSVIQYYKDENGKITVR